ncbi:MAG: EAL domain-containing protein [Candidatus Accumulibacter sp.]|nr:EAL domain-containing protein [Accumulibacter sp.]
MSAPAMDAAPLADVLFVTDSEGVVRDVQGPLQTMFGRGRAEVLGQPLSMLIRPQNEALACCSAASGVHLALGRRDGGDFPVCINPTHAGSLCYLHVRPQGCIAHYAVSALASTPATVDDIASLHEALLESVSHAFISVGLDGRINFFNRAAQRMLGYRAEEVVSHHTPLLFHDPQEIAGLAERLAGERGPSAGAGMDVFFQRESQGEVVEAEWTYIRKDGSRFPVLLATMILRNARREVIGCLGVATDLSERKRAEATIDFLAHNDPLTRLPNRTTLLVRLEQAIADARRQGHRLALLFIDLDRFKTINDTLGHPLGDRLLVAVAQRIAQTVRESDTLARLGGDEFVVVLPGIAREMDAAQLAIDISRILAEPFEIGAHQLHTAASMGISLFPHDGSDPETLMKNADTALHHAKARGRGNFQFYAAQMNESAAEHLALENGLRQALVRGEFELHFQPQMRIADRRLIGFEALIRWRHPGKGLLAPVVFIPLAEESGLIARIGEWVIGEACRQAVAWQATARAPVRVAVNLSVRQFAQPDLLGQVRRALDASGLAPALLELEITESALMESPEKAVEVLRELRAMGVCLALDDFGTGYSSLSYLKHLPINRLKIDRSFVSEIGVDANDTAIATATIALAHKLGLEVVAEGIETPAQLALLAAEGCDEGQGYYFSRPLAPALVAGFIEREAAA